MSVIMYMKQTPSRACTRVCVYFLHKNLNTTSWKCGERRRGDGGLSTEERKQKGVTEEEKVWWRERERGNQAGDKSVGSNIAELKVTWVLISCQWKREQYQDWNTSFNESLVQGAQWAQAVNIQNIIPPSLTLSAPCSSTLCYCIGTHTHTHAHRPAHTRINAATYMCPH